MTAFPKPSPRVKRRPNPGHPYLTWLKTCGCVVCGSTPSEAAHVQGPISLKTGTILARRNHEAYLSAIPACPVHHRTGPGALDTIGEAQWSLDHYGRVDGAARAAFAYLARWAMEGGR